MRKIDKVHMKKYSGVPSNQSNSGSHSIESSSRRGVSTNAEDEPGMSNNDERVEFNKGFVIASSKIVTTPSGPVSARMQDVSDQVDESVRHAVVSMIKFGMREQDIVVLRDKDCSSLERTFREIGKDLHDLPECDMFLFFYIVGSGQIVEKHTTFHTCRGAPFELERKLLELAKAENCFVYCLNDCIRTSIGGGGSEFPPKNQNADYFVTHGCKLNSAEPRVGDNSAEYFVTLLKRANKAHRNFSIFPDDLPVELNGDK